MIVRNRDDVVGIITRVSATKAVDSRNPGFDPNDVDNPACIFYSEEVQMKAAY